MAIGSRQQDWYLKARNCFHLDSEFQTLFGGRVTEDWMLRKEKRCHPVNNTLDKTISNKTLNSKWYPEVSSPQQVKRGKWQDVCNGKLSFRIQFPEPTPSLIPSTWNLVLQPLSNISDVWRGSWCHTESANENAQSSLLGSCAVSPSYPPLLSAHLLGELCIWLPSSGQWGWQEVQLRLALSIGLQHPARNQVDQTKPNKTKHPKWVLKESNIHLPVGWTFSAGKGSFTLGAPGNSVSGIFLWVNSRMWLWGTRAWEKCKPWNWECFSVLAVGQQEDRAASGQEAGCSHL